MKIPSGTVLFRGAFGGIKDAVGHEQKRRRLLDIEPYRMLLKSHGPCIFRFAVLSLALAGVAHGQAAPAGGAKGDSLGRDNPRAAVIHFLETCRTGDYQKASRYLDLDQIPSANRAEEGGNLAKQLEAILNSAAQFDVNSITQDSDGDSTQTVATITRYGQPNTLTVTRKSGENGAPAFWQFSAQTVAAIPSLAPTSENPLIARYLPKFFSTVQLLETPVWKWLGLALAALVLLSLSRVLDRFFALFTRKLGDRTRPGGCPGPMK